jgi:hypothetical protein
MRRRYKLWISVTLIAMVSFVYLNSTGENVVVTTQNETKDNTLGSLDNVTLTTGYFSTHLKVCYTCYELDQTTEDVVLTIALSLSLNNASWIEVENYRIEASNLVSNVSKTFIISNSIFQSFPFDIEQEETLYICIEFIEGNSWYSSGERSGPLTLEIPLDIIRPWYFTMDWTLPSIFGFIFLSLFAVFLISRNNRKLIERAKSED